MLNKTLYYCRGELCAGLPWPASFVEHPRTCLKDPAVWPGPAAQDGNPWFLLIHVRDTDTASELARANTRTELESLAAGITVELARACYALTDGREVLAWPPALRPGLIFARAAQRVVDLWKSARAVAGRG
ncbi:hypothetical protein OV203_32235 [Nannocystis sp. ILAH1]|uniref:hypothetical protein n=1 Tax=Nannocystis sp. ILAH1 TaxID=2996789 RepID=UPI00226E6446|nr:hypothetical protein [Nannocystis sp. ILAH1]MCY0991852.1 hypothetical protein [Nannocystis sp. ILAH1]